MEGKKMENVRYIYQVKQGREYMTTFCCTDEKQVYDDLAHELIAKKINNCLWIRSIKRENLYNGYERITVYYDHGEGRRVYTVTSH
jgi:hypothetical protein